MKKYTKSRMHEKLDKIKKLSCGITGLFLASTIVLSVLAKENDDNVISVYQVNTVEVSVINVVGNQRVINVQTIQENTEQVIEETSDFIYIRCTAYCDTGYTASGAWTTDGCLAGKREWLGRQCRLYRANKDGSMGECIGTFTFKDTGFGLEELDGIYYPDGTIKNGASIDMWHATEDECWSWVAKYGDYVYMEFIQ